MSPKKWIEKTNGILSKSGRYGGTYAHIDIALEFASWVSVEFKFYMIKEFQRLKQEENKGLDWDVKRSLTKLNYRIHTDAIKQNLIQVSLCKQAIYIQKIADLEEMKKSVLQKAFSGKLKMES